MFESFFVGRVEGDENMALTPLVGSFENMAVSVKPGYCGTVSGVEHHVERLLML